MEKKVHDLRELRDKLVVKTISEVDVPFDTITFTDGSRLEFKATVFLPEDVEFKYIEK